MVCVYPESESASLVDLGVEWKAQKHHIMDTNNENSRNYRLDVDSYWIDRLPFRRAIGRTSINRLDGFMAGEFVEVGHGLLRRYSSSGLG